jgi:hypothetical protein
VVYPEGHPGQHDHQGGREIGLEQEEEDVSTQSEINVETIVPAWAMQGRKENTIHPFSCFIKQILFRES